MVFQKCLIIGLLVPLTCSMVVWPVLDRSTNTTRAAIRPKNWSEKNLGQWCRNLSVNQHTQCPQASAFHQFDCCGPSETECCFAIQGWVIIILTIIAACSTITLIFTILLKLNLICLPSTIELSKPYQGIRE
ncbi:unnamed protein product [Caenorhabditis angaria]|uniref:Uncharacterized protein n=1 Tax=Caenorhabditis angaria TaxID=860376 RepID=A0A9P1MV70_9PELO|nr:unnamed protein product [Caenorhabditis angaria]